MDSSYLIRIDQEEIKRIIADYYGIATDGVCLYHDYMFVKQNEDKVRKDFIFGIVDLRSKTGYHPRILQR